MIEGGPNMKSRGVRTKLLISIKSKQLGLEHKMLVTGSFLSR
jgi:hypothetical protein